MIDGLGWDVDSLEHRGLAPKCACFIRSIKGMLLPLCQLRSLEIQELRAVATVHLANDTYKFSFYPRAIRTWNISVIPESLKVKCTK